MNVGGGGGNCDNNMEKLKRKDRKTRPPCNKGEERRENFNAVFTCKLNYYLPVL
jgi:hypothetical protein